MTYKAKLVQQDRLGYNQFDIIKAALSSDIYQCKMGDIRIATHDHSANAFWQAQRLKITDDKGMLIASYPQIPNISYKIDLADVRKWIESGCKESVELEIELSDTYTRDGLQPRLNLTNNTVKMVWGEQDKAQPIAGDWADGIDNMKRPCYALFKHMSDNHNLTLLETELGDIVNVVNGMKPQQVAGADYENQYKLLQYEHSKLIERCAGLDAMVKVVKHHPATDWEALGRRFHGWFIDRSKKQPYDTESILNFFKNEINGK